MLELRKAHSKINRINQQQRFNERQKQQLATRFDKMLPDILNSRHRVASALQSGKGIDVHHPKVHETNNFAQKNCFAEAGKLRPEAYHTPHESRGILVRLILTGKK
jgi:hypothetical protein